MPDEESCPLMEAYILVSVRLGELWKVAEEVRKIPGIKKASAVAGRFDVVAHAEAANISWVIARIHGVKGVVKTESLITLEARFE
jgi:DNA-binding Lrp family transcriptional regulator